MVRKEIKLCRANLRQSHYPSGVVAYTRHSPERGIVAKRVWGSGLVDPGFSQGLLHGPLNWFLIGVVAPLGA